MRVAHFVQRYPPALGGSEAYFARLSRHLARAGERVTVFTTSALDLEGFWSPQGRCLPPDLHAPDKGVQIERYRLWRMRGRRYLLKPLSLVPYRPWQCLTLPCNPIAWGMWADAGRRMEPFDIVHATAFPYAWPIMCGRRLARRLGVPLVLTPFLHLGDPAEPGDRTRRAYLSRPLQWLLQSADRVLVQTRLERDALLSEGLAPDKLALQGLGVEPAECTGGDRAAARRAWGVGQEEVVVGHLANNSEEKGTVDLLRAAERAWGQNTKFAVVLAGPEMTNFRRFWRVYRPLGRVFRLGVLDDRQRRDFYAGIDLFALPSRSDSFGLVLLEAWANGRANLAYRAGGVAELIRDGQDGLLARCGDVEELAEHLTRLVCDAGFRQALGRVGQARVAREFRWSDKLDLVHQVYRELAERKGTGRSEVPCPFSSLQGTE